MGNISCVKLGRLSAQTIIREIVFLLGSVTDTYEWVRINMENVIIQEDRTMLTVLMITIALDFMGFLLVFPLFPDLFIAKTSVLVPVSASLTMRYFYYALAQATWPAGC